MSDQWEYCVVRHQAGYLKSVTYNGVPRFPTANNIPLGQALSFLEGAGWQIVSVIETSEESITDLKRHPEVGRSVDAPPFPPLQR